MKRKVLLAIICVLGIVTVISGSCFLAYSSSPPHRYDNEYFIYDETKDTVRTIKLPARQTIEDVRSSSIAYKLKKHEERELTYDGSWKSNNTQILQYIDGDGGMYMFNGNTNELRSMFFTYSATKRAQEPPTSITKAELLNLADGYIQLYVPYAEQYTLWDWQEQIEKDGEYDSGAYGMSFGIPVKEDWFFSSMASVKFDSCGRVTMFTIPTNDSYALISEEERNAVANALPDEEELDKLLQTYLTDRCGEGLFSIRTITSKSVKKEEDGYQMTVILDISRGREGSQHAEQIVYEETLNIPHTSGL